MNYAMARILLVLFSVFCCFGLHQSNEEEKKYHPECPPFPCGKLGKLCFPFTRRDRSAHCGLLSVEGCEHDEDIQTIQLQKDGAWDRINNISQANTIFINDDAFWEHLQNKSCETFNNISFPSFPYLSFEINPNLTLFKCDHNLSDSTASISLLSNYSCSNFTIYYNERRDPVGLPECSLNELPSHRFHRDQPKGNIFDVLTAILEEENVRLTATTSFLVPMLQKHQSMMHLDSSPLSMIINGTLRVLVSYSLHPHTRNECPQPVLFWWIMAKEVVANVGLNRAKVSVSVLMDHHIPKHCHDGTSRRLIITVAIAIPVAGISMFAILAFYCRNELSSDDLFSWIKKSEDDEKIEAFLRNCGPLALRRFSFMDIKKMTKSFDEKLGQGGFGSVYKGKLPDGCNVAVKVLVKTKGNGEEFINEVASISRTSHVNIVTLLGFCFQGSKRALIYEFMPNGSLERYINGGNPLKPNRQLGWETLYKIAVGIARGLEYLHRDCNTRILHFDIKPHNILLDENLSPKICDFGLSKICLRKESIVSMEGARGTAGYIAPEVFSRNFGPVSHKSDVYSYGMLVLEMVGGRRNISVEVEHTSEIYFPHWICKRIELAEELGLHGISNEDENRKARQLILVSLWCIQTDPANRPPMRRVIEMLQGDLGSIPIPPRPYLSSPSRSPPKSIVDSSAAPISNL